jgi:hypothetical protein
MKDLITLNSLGFALFVFKNPEHPELTTFSANYHSRKFEPVRQDAITELLEDPEHGADHFNMAVKSLLIRVRNYLKRAK